MGWFSFDLTFVREPELLRVSVVGEFSLRKDQRGWARLVKEVKRHSVRRVLIDGRDVSGDLSKDDLFAVGKRVGDQIPFKVAMLRRRLDKDELTAWVARYHGANFQLFAEEAEARAWLLRD